MFKAGDNVKISLFDDKTLDGKDYKFKVLGYFKKADAYLLQSLEPCAYCTNGEPNAPSLTYYVSKKDDTIVKPSFDKKVKDKFFIDADMLEAEMQGKDINKILDNLLNDLLNDIFKRPGYDNGKEYYEVRVYLSDLIKAFKRYKK